MSRFELPEIQAQAILDLRLRALTALERKRVEDEHRDLEERIAELRAILGDPARIDGLIREAVRAQADLRSRDDRRTEIVAAEGELGARGPDRGGGHGHRDHALGYVKRLPVSTYRAAARRGSA